MNPARRDGDRPLYAQVRERLIERIRSGDWKPGQLIPNEFEIAAEFGVSQGTARKAIGDSGRRAAGGAPAGPRHVRGRAHAGACFVPLFQPVRRDRRPRDPRQPRTIGAVGARPTSEERKALGLDDERRR